jgi:hypothetical protein
MAGSFLRSTVRGLRRPSQLAVGNAQSRQALMKIVLLIVGPLLIAAGLFCFGQGTGLISGPHNAVLLDAGAGAVALGIATVWFALR